VFVRINLRAREGRWGICNGGDDREKMEVHKENEEPFMRSAMKRANVKLWLCSGEQILIRGLDPQLWYMCQVALTNYASLVN
jgi:hypothetical protein